MNRVPRKALLVGLPLLAAAVWIAFRKRLNPSFSPVAINATDDAPPPIDDLPEGKSPLDEAVLESPFENNSAAALVAPQENEAAEVHAQNNEDPEVAVEANAPQDYVFDFSALPSDCVEAILRVVEVQHGSSGLASLRLVNFYLREAVDSRGVHLSSSSLFAYGGTLEDILKFPFVSTLTLNVDNIEENKVVEVLKNIKVLRKVSFEGLNGSNAICECLSGHASLHSLEFKRSRIPHVHFVKNLQELTDLNFSECRIGDENMSVLGRMKKLENLTIENCSMRSSNFLQHLNSIPNLKELKLGLKNFIGKDLLSLVFLKANLSLSIYGQRSSNMLSVIKFLPTLTGLCLHGCTLDHLGFPLKRLGCLNRLRMSAGTIFPPDVVNLLGVKDQLESLDVRLENTRMEIVNALLRADLPIRSLVVKTNTCSLTDHLTECPYLKTLRVSASREVDSGIFSMLRFFPNLEDITLGEMLYDAGGLSELTVFCPCLKRLTIGSCILSADHLMELAELEVLETVNLRCCVIQDVSAFSHMKSLKHLTFDRCSSIENQLGGLFDAEFIKSLEILSISLTDEIPFEETYGDSLRELTQQQLGLRIHVFGPDATHHY